MTTSQMKASIEFSDANWYLILNTASQREISINDLVNTALDTYFSAPGSVLNPWVHSLSMMQQSVLLAMVRNADGIDKHHPQKELIKWFRRCVLKSAFDGQHLTAPDMPGGGSFTGPVANIYDALDQFIWARDSMTLHYFAHAMHAFEILGYKYPDQEYRQFWHIAYLRMVNALHMNPETESEMDRRLCDNENTWREREDVCGGCTSTEMKTTLIASRSYEERQKERVSFTVTNGVGTETYSDGSWLSGPVGEQGCIGDPGVAADEPNDALAKYEAYAKAHDTGEPIPDYAAIDKGGHFVNKRSGNGLGHDFDLKWAHRHAEFPRYVPPAHDERGWQPK